MTEIAQLEAACLTIDQCLSTAGVRSSVNLEGVRQGYVELYSIVDGVEYEIRIRVRNPADAANRKNSGAYSALWRG
jgi:hypothetical protein